MKAIHSLLLATLLSQPAWSQEAAPGNPAPGQIPTVENLLPNQQAFLNLSQEQRAKFIGHFKEANRLFSQKRIFETLEEAHKASEVFADSPEIHNLKGSCYVEMRAFDKAMASFERAAALSSRTNSILFNIGEVQFVTREWQKASQTFEELLRRLPPDDLYLGRLTLFKILLCKIRMNQMNEAKVLAERYDYLDDSPYYYFSQAAIAYEEKNLVEAEQWIARANRIFRNESILSPWHDTLVEFGYIKSFYGGEE